MIPELAKELVPPEDKENPAMSRWRWKMWATLMLVVTVLSALLLSLYVDWIPGLKISGVAYASDVEESIQQVREDLTADINDLSEKVVEQGSKQDTILRITLAQEICRVVRLRSEAAETEQTTLFASLNANYERIQGEYAAINGNVRYNPAECG